MRNNDIIHLTDKGEMVAEGYETVAPTSRTIGDDILKYLEDASDKKAAVEEIGMNVKILPGELNEALQQLERGGYVAVEQGSLERHFTEGPLKGMRIPEEFHKHPGKFPHGIGGAYNVEESNEIIVEGTVEPCEGEEGC